MTESDPLPGASDPRPRWRRTAGIAVRWGITLLVAIGVGRRIWLEKEKLAAYDLHLKAAPLVAAGASYLAGLATCAVFWRWAMCDSGARPTWTSTLAAYYAGHLGKYVPGKGLVLVIRGTMVRGPGVGTASAVITAAQETVFMMATGALVAAGLWFGTNRSYDGRLAVIAGGLALGLGVLASPPVAGRLGRLALAPFPNATAGQTVRLCWRTMVAGLGLVAFGWLLMGLSLVGVLAAMAEADAVVAQRGLIGTIGLATAAIALATVIGYVSLTPGGLGSREWMLMEALDPLVGHDRAVIAAVVLRIVWVVAEAAAAGVFWMVDRRWKRLHEQPS